MKYLRHGSAYCNESIQTGNFNLGPRSGEGADSPLHNNNETFKNAFKVRNMGFRHHMTWKYFLYPLLLIAIFFQTLRKPLNWSKVNKPGPIIIKLPEERQKIYLRTGNFKFPTKDILRGYDCHRNIASNAWSHETSGTIQGKYVTGPFFAFYKIHLSFHLSPTPFYNRGTVKILASLGGKTCYLSVWPQLNRKMTSYSKFTKLIS